MTYRLEGNSNAINRFEYLSNELVKVLHWFSDFWIFIEIRFISNEIVEKRKKVSQTNISISVSVFQGDDEKDMKYQLFRAEWDDFNNPEELHSQPHWHITSNQAIERTLLEYAVDFEKSDFVSMLEQEKEKVFDVNKIHFAMNGNWQNDQTNIHEIGDERKIVKWFRGMLKHIRTELE